MPHLVTGALVSATHLPDAHYFLSHSLLLAQNFNWSWSRQRFTDFPPASLPLDEAAGTTSHFTATVRTAGHL